MIQMTKTCVICKAATSLNTQTLIKIEEQQYQVSVCGNCEDNASPKVVREALSKRLELLRAMCLEVNSLLGGDLTIDKIISGRVSQPAPAAVETEEAAEEGPGGVKVLSKPIQRGQARANAPVRPGQRPPPPKNALGKPIAIPKEAGDVKIITDQSKIQSINNTKLGGGGWHPCPRCVDHSNPRTTAGTGLVGNKPCANCAGTGLVGAQA